MDNRDARCTLEMQFLAPSCGIPVVSFDALPTSPVENHPLAPSVAVAFGEGGPGIIVVKGVPKIRALRRTLLETLHEFGNLPEDIREKYTHPDSKYSVGWSLGKESMIKGVFDTSKGSYYFNPLSNDPFAHVNAKEQLQWQEFTAKNVWPTEVALEDIAMEVGKLMVEVGKRLAIVCDCYTQNTLGAEATFTGLYRTIDTSPNVKSRMLYYYPSESSNWCGWHNDHSSLTGLLPAMYFHSDSGECPAPTKSLQIARRDGRVMEVEIPEDCIAFQIGETAQIHTGGVLQATPHCVTGGHRDISRVTMATFMGPCWYDPMEVPTGTSKSYGVAESRLGDVSEAVKGRVPLLENRWKPGISFGEFSKKTIASYYS